MSLIVQPGQELTQQLSNFTNSQPTINVLNNISEATTVLSSVDFDSFHVEFDVLNSEFIGEDLVQIFYTCQDERAFSRFWNKLRSCLPSASLQSNYGFDLRLNVCTSTIAQVDRTLELVSNELGCPTVFVDQNTLFVQEGSEYTLLKNVSPPVEPACVPEFSLKLENNKRPGFYIANSSFEVQRVKTEKQKQNNWKISGTGLVRASEMVCVERFAGRRAYISYPFKGWVNLKDDLLAPKFIRTLPAAEYELTTGVHLCQTFAPYEQIYYKKGTRVQVLEARNKHYTPQKIYVKINSEAGFIPLFEKQNRKYKMTLKPIRGNVYRTQNQSTVAVSNSVSDTASVASSAFTAKSWAATAWTNSVSVYAESVCSSMSSKSVKETNVTNEVKTFVSATNFGEVGLYRARRNCSIKVFADEELNKPLFEGRRGKKSKQVVELRSNDVFEIVAFYDVKMHNRTFRRAEIDGRVSGYIRFARGDLVNHTQEFTSGEHKLGFMNVEVVNESYNFVTELPKWSKVEVVSVEGAYAKICKPVCGYIPLAQARLKKE